MVVMEVMVLMVLMVLMMMVVVIVIVMMMRKQIARELPYSIIQTLSAEITDIQKGEQREFYRLTCSRISMRNVLVKLKVVATRNLQVTSAIEFQ